MSSTLYEATVMSFGQTMEAMSGLLQKAEAFCVEQGIAPHDMLEHRIRSDMQPFTYQVKSTRVHSIGAIEGLRRGSFSPDVAIPPDSFAGLHDLVSETRDALKAVTPEEIDALGPRDMVFEMGAYRAGFTGQSFLLSFSMPNFHFHATIAYALLRAQGMNIGKVDYLGRVGTRLPSPSPA